MAEPSGGSDLAGHWRIQRGRVTGLSTGDEVEVAPSSDGLRWLIIKPGVGAMASARMDRVNVVGEHATMIDHDYNVDVDLVALHVTASRRREGHLLALDGIAVASSQLPLVERDWCHLYFDPEALVVMPNRVVDDDQIATIPYGEITSLHVGGRGVLNSTTGGGWIGGGFGVTGALEGIAFASIMNALTTRQHTAIETLIEFSAGARAAIVLNDSEPPDLLRVHLAPIFDRIDAAHRAPYPRALPSLKADRITQLKQLAELRDAGILTEEEFQAEKARVLAS